MKERKKKDERRKKKGYGKSTSQLEVKRFKGLYVISSDFHTSQHKAKSKEGRKP